jgi:hypothetical protein
MIDINDVSAAGGLAFVFDLHLVCGGCAYFSTYTDWRKHGNHGREIRAPRPVKTMGFYEAMAGLGLEAALLAFEWDIEDWMLRRGWAIVPMDFCRAHMPQWLRARECIRDSTFTFTDISIASEGALTHYASVGKRELVIQRDKRRCLLCGKSESEGAKLTMQHVLPYGHGGATTTRNLVSLCEECNQKSVTQHLYHLFELAGLPHFPDLGLVRGEITEEKMHSAYQISANLMHTRCEVW